MDLNHIARAIIVASATAMGLAHTAIGCGAFTTADGALSQAGYAAGCIGISFVPVVGGILAGICTGEETLVNAAIASAVAKAGDAGAIKAAVTSNAPMVALYHRRGAIVVHIGYAPKLLASDSQAYLDAHPYATADGGM